MASETTASPPQGIGFKEFVGMMAAIMAVNALAIDTMLPALADIGDAVGIPTESGRQWIITSYLLGSGISQLFPGTLADRFGRKRVLLAGLAMYVVFGAMSALATSFESLVIARVLQGVGTAAARVLAVSIVRDRYAGRQMARVMSLTLTVFLVVPVIAPSLGQLIMLVAPWRWIFGALTFYAVAVMVWVVIRLPETIHPEDRMPISLSSISHALGIVLTNRVAVGYMFAQAFVVGGTFGYINSAQQIFVDVFAAPGLFTTVFAMIGFSFAVSSIINARIVGRFGMRLISHTAVLGYMGFAAIHTAIALTGHENIWVFAVLQSAMMFCFGLVGPNFGALAMEPMGHVAGTASSVQGFVTTTGGALLGFIIGQLFNGSVVPLTLGFFSYGLIALILAAITEKGRLFKPSPMRA